MTKSTKAAIRFESPVGLPLEAAFDAGRLTSDGGLPWLSEADGALGRCEALAGCIRDWRRGPVRHALVTLVRQRVYQIACGDEDPDDADTLRADPLLKLVCGRLPESGADRASQPTLSRLENAVDRQSCYRLAQALVAVDQQERERDGVPGRGVVAIPKRLMAAFRARWPGVRIDLRADSGFAIPALYDYCEAEGIAYTIGLAPNARLEALAAPLLAEARRQQAETGAAKVGLAGEAEYQATTWPRPRRVVFKAEALAKGPNTRFVVTTRTDAPLLTYAWYVDRGTPEQWIGDFKLACFADRLSCHRFWANQFRLLLHAAAYWLLDTLRRWLARLGVPRLQLATLRLRLLKIGGRVRQLLTRVSLSLASHHPGEPLWQLLANAHFWSGE